MFHLPLTHPDSSAFSCHICDKTFNSDKKLNLHINFDHREKWVGVACQICNFLFPTQEEYKKHLSGLQHNAIKKNEDYEDSESEDDYIDACGLCGIVLYSYEEVDNHQSNYLGCDEYSVCFHNQFQWSRHENCER